VCTRGGECCASHSSTPCNLQTQTQVVGMSMVNIAHSTHSPHSLLCLSCSSEYKEPTILFKLCNIMLPRVHNVIGNHTAVQCTQLNSHTSLMLQIFTEQSSLPLASLVGSTCEKCTDQALLRCSVNCVKPWPVVASHSCIFPNF
jgi:hypothetical protein